MTKCVIHNDQVCDTRVCDQVGDVIKLCITRDEAGAAEVLDADAVRPRPADDAVQRPARRP